MLDAVRDLGGYSIYATDGPVGSVSDLYFDDKSWRVRYLVVKAGGLISNRRVLVSPGFVSGVDAGTMTLYADLTTEQVANSPGIETDRLVAAQQEADSYAYYGTVPYWNAGFTPDLTGAAYTDAHQIQPPPDAEETEPHVSRDDPHLRSAREVEGYRIRSMDGEIGHVEDFVVDVDVWAIRYAVVDTRNWLPGKKVLVAVSWISGVDWADAEVSVDLGSVEIREAPAPPGTGIDRDYEIKLHSYYGRPPYWIYDK